MKKILWVIGGLLGLFVIAVLVVPNVIDWNTYKPEITEQVRKLTGRQLVIAGDINLKILPAPVLIAEKVSISSIDGAQSPDLASLRHVEIRIALAPLLGGNISVETVRLVEPKIYLEVLADGRTTWTITPPKPESATAGSQVEKPAANGSSSGPGIAIGQFEVVDGTVVYQDAASGTHERIEDIDLSFAAASLSAGPYRANGTLVARGLRLGINAEIGEVVSGRSFPLDLSLLVGGESAKITLAGTVLGLNETPRFRGTLNVASDNIGRVVSALADGAALPAPLSQRLTLSGTLDASRTALALDDLQLDFGGALGTGKVSGDFANKPKLNAALTIDRIDADPWLDQKPAAASAPSQNAGPSTAANPSAPPQTQTGDEGFSLPSGITASLAVKIGEVSLKGDTLNNAVLNAELANGELSLSQLSVQGPGGTDLAVFGFLTAMNGKPSFDGQVQARVREPRVLMKWAGVDSTALKPGKPGALSLNIDAQATPDTVSVRKLALAFDKTNISGAATIALRQRIGIGASVVVDQIDLDAYLADAAPVKTGEPAKKPADGSQPAPTDTSGAGDSGMFDALKSLAAFDANLKANVGSLKTAGIPMRDLAVDISLLQGDLTIRKLSVADVLSTGASMTGSLLGLDAVPSAKGLAIRAEVRDAGKLASFAGIDLPVPARALGKVDLAADINGPLIAPDLKSTVKAMAATLNVDGKLKPLEPANMFDLALRVRHGDLAAFLRKLGSDYRPSGAIGAMDVSTAIKGGLDAFSFSKLVAAVGAAKINGEGTVQLAGARPKITTTLSAGNVVVDPFLPAQKSASLNPDQPARIMPARYRVPEGGGFDLKQLIATVSERWSSEQIDLTALQSVDADFTLTAPRISFREYNLDGARLLGGIDNGLLKVNEFSGSVFGGSVMSNASVNASTKLPALAGVFTVGNMDIGAASKAAGIAGTTGMLTSRIDVTTVGRSVSDWVGALDGKGAIEIRGIKGESSLSDLPVIGLALGPLMQVFEVLNSGLGSLIGAGGKTRLGESDVTSSFTISNGIINTKDTKLLSNIYEGNIAGDINLPLWSMNVGGTVAVDQGLLGAVLSNVARIPTSIPFQVTGNIDKPNVKIQSFSGAGSAGGQGIAIPGLDKLEKKVPGVGGLLQGILGGGNTSGSGGTTPQQQQPAPQPQQQQEQPAPQPQQQKIDPADILKQLFK
ncbi:MAG: AsmA family protein [Rhodospirillales bacterium]